MTDDTTSSRAESRKDPRPIRTISFCAMVVGILTLVFTRPPKIEWEAEARIRVARPRPSEGSPECVITLIPAHDAETHQVTITGQATLIRVAHNLKILPEEYLAMDAEDILRESYSDAHVADIVNDLRDRIKVEREGKTNILTIRARSTRPRGAQQLADVVAETHAALTNAQNNRTLERVREFVDHRFVKAQTRLAKAEAALQAKRASLSAVPLGHRTAEAIVAERDGLEHRANAAACEIEKLNQSKASRGQASIWVAPDWLGDNPVVKHLNQRLVDRQIEKHRLLAQETPDNPKIKQVQSEIELLVDTFVPVLKAIQASAKARLQRIGQTLQQAPQVQMELAQAEADVKKARDAFAGLASTKEHVETACQEASKTIWIEERALGARRIKKPGKLPKVFAGCIVGVLVGLAWSSRTVRKFIVHEWGVPAERPSQSPAVADSGDALAGPSP